MSNYFAPNAVQYPENIEQPLQFIGGLPDAFASTGTDQWYGSEQQSSGPPSKSSAKTRLRNPPAQDHVKHRRTRSGCYTCRERRVKVPFPSGPYRSALLTFSPRQCDEARPTCERKFPRMQIWLHGPLTRDWGL